MKKLIVFIVFIGFICTLFSDQVVLKNRRTFDGTILGKKGSLLYISTEELGKKLYFAIEHETIEQIMDDNIPINTDTFFSKNDFSNNINLSKIKKITHIKSKNSNQAINSKQYKNVIKNEYILLSAALGFLAWDYFTEASDISSQIKELNDIDNHNLKSELTDIQTRKFIVGLALSASSVFTLVTAFDKVELSASPNSINLSYNF